jgi:alkanesulfonate monooxygenase SsuD/methylene tetrahydromethanopterin reductase-like flavin-dependent oxidoreductase (luciferase family)
MKIGMLSEAQISKGMTYGARIREVIKEAIFAEEMGFDFFGCSEQHLAGSAYSVSAPEVIFGALAVLTSRIKLRHMSIAALRFNHPIRTAERIATLDILTGGRIEVGTARSNNIAYLNAFGVDPSTTRDDWRENLEVIIRALMEPTFEFHGKYYDIGPVSVVPKLESKKCPPFFVSATSPETHANAARIGIGVFSADQFWGWDYLDELASAYKNAIGEAQPIGGLYEVNNTMVALAFPTCCAASKEQAIGEAASTVRGILYSAIHMYAAMAASGAADYEYMGRMKKELEDHVDDIPYMMAKTPLLMLGTPDDLIEHIYRFESMGFSEVILKIDGLGHQANLRTIELVGKYVIPEFRSRHSIPENEWEELGVEVERFQL